MEQNIIDQIKYGVKYLPFNAVKGRLTRRENGEMERFRLKAGGTICGVCHPNENYAQLEAGNIKWIRIDIPFPFDRDGNQSESYLGFKERCKGYTDRGFKVMAVTPYPHQFIEGGVDPVADEKEVRRIARFFTTDLKDYAAAFQITNEMGVPHFILPLTMDEAARFIRIQAEAMRETKTDILIGYNSAGPQADLHLRLKPFMFLFDYVGIDIYIGCFANVGGFMWFYDVMLDYLYNFTKKPIILQEFGYIGSGEPKSKAEKAEILKQYGVSSEREAKKNIEAFVSNLPPRIKEHISHVSPDPNHQWEFLFKSDFANHIYCELPRVTLIPGYPHNHEGQAKFFRDILPRLYNIPYLCGIIIYCYSDSERCYICGQEECPTETKWGLVEVSGKEKPSYYAVKKAFGDIQKADRLKLKL